MNRFSLFFAVCLAILVFSGSYQTVSGAEMGAMMQDTRTLAAAQQVSSARQRSSRNVANYGMSRREIKSMPITERPNRPGHFYGNTVRRRAGM